jgi:tetrathionate reductase subunit B
MSKKGISRRDVLKGLTATSIIVVATGCGEEEHDEEGVRWGYAIDIGKCIGCTSCMRACSMENEVPHGHFRTWVERYRVDSHGNVDVDAPQGDMFSYPEMDGDVAKAFFVPKLCNHCEKSVCSQVCPVGASYHSEEGAVLVDDKHCIGCGYCVQACPYGCRFINEETHVADKCTWCYHRTKQGMNPACVDSCPKGARIFGDLNDPTSHISEILRQHGHRVLKQEMGTEPMCFYRGLDREVI